MTYRTLIKTLGATALLSLTAGAAVQAQTHVGDVVLDGSLCVGLDCPAPFNEGFTTILMMENNTRIKFDDTSVAAAFPNQDWGLDANESTNGGRNAFFVRNCGVSSQGNCSGNAVFTAEAGARNFALYVEADGDVGFGTSNPVTDLHTVNGDTPTLRLEQNNGAGFTPQTFDVAANETNFFVRDVTNGSTLPFRIRPGAPTSAIDVAANGNVGLGDATPEEELDIQGGANDTIAIELENDTTWRIRNQGAAGATDGWLEFRNADVATTIPMRIAANANNNLLLVGAADSSTADADQVTITGDLVISGQCTEVDGACADYVFEDGYELMPLHDVSAFIAENGHLPNIPSAVEMEQGGVNMAMMSGRLLAKIEELTLYTLEQQKTIDALKQRLDME